MDSLNGDGVFLAVTERFSQRLLENESTSLLGDSIPSSAAWSSISYLLPSGFERVDERGVWKGPCTEWNLLLPAMNDGPGFLLATVALELFCSCSL